MGENVSVFRPHGFSARVSEEISFEQFCAADHGGTWVSRTHLPNGMIVLIFSRWTMVCSPDGSCLVTKMYGASMDDYLEEACACLDKVA